MYKPMNANLRWITYSVHEFRPRTGLKESGICGDAFANQARQVKEGTHATLHIICLTSISDFLTLAREEIQA